ncbi:cation diffusion facilitator family transporter [Halieaceae bacterium IMCC14734]|uniref:Cation diffusion facilitator family transporter n=1 Tax=Candidatus Litorirhabdus singularis TaxID=2518993 RepID=A0ABT3TAZ8_9GAMM|nr:cation diffusion facilitator family transporter [Candidatus Litorirhabdus singularis]MCX2979452.1 cation diffusion facilitator family transporter [Candidatus Litorirhabdus singularis]
MNPVSHTTEVRLLKWATAAAVLTATILIMAKLGAYMATESVSLLASLIDSLMDGGASLLNLFAVRYALTPPDAEHRFGHGKAESLAGLAQAVFIGGSGIFLIVEAIQRLINPQPLEQIGVGIAVMSFSIVLTSVLVIFQRYVIKRTHSTAIKADSFHYATDIVSNGAIVLALLIAQMGWFGIDPALALIIAVWVLYCAWKIANEALQDLLDRELPTPQRDQIISAACAHPSVHGVHDLRTRVSGRMRFIQLHIELDDFLPLHQAHVIADQVEAAILEVMPGSDVVIHQDPLSINDERQAEFDL